MPLAPPAHPTIAALAIRTAARTTASVRIAISSILKSERSLLRRALHFEQSLFSLHSPPVASHAAIFANHAMARDRDRDRIRGAGAGDGAAGTRLSDSLGHLAIRFRGAEWN